MSKTYRHSVLWGNPYTSPPNNLPRILVIERSTSHIASEKFSRKAHRIISRFREKGIYTYSQAWDWEEDMNKPKRTWSLEAKVKNRRQRLRKRLEKKYSIPLLLESAYQQAISSNPSYFGDPLTL